MYTALPFTPKDLFNHIPQSGELGITLQGAYAFSPNVVLVALRLINPLKFQGQAPCFSCGVIDVYRNLTSL